TDPGTGTENGYRAGVEKVLVILGRNDSPDDHHDILPAVVLQFLDHLGHQGLVSGCQGRYAKNVHIVLHSLFGCFCGSLEQRTYIYIKTYVSVTCGHYLGPAVMTILPHFGNHYPGSPAFFLSEMISQFPGFLKCWVFFYLS